MRYLADFAESFVLLFGAYFDVLSASLVVMGMMLALAWAIIPQITKRL